MPVPVMGVREVRVVVYQWGMPMRVAVRLTERVVWTVVMLMVFVVHVRVLMIDGVVLVSMGVALEK